MTSLASVWMIVRKSLRRHALSSAVTVGSAALASGLVMSVFAISAQSRDAFIGGPAGFDAVLGGRGSALQLVLNTVFHLETSPGNIPYKMYTDLAQDPRIEVALPYALGDNFDGFRIVGTTEELFTVFEYEEGKRLTPAAGGRGFDPARREAVIGDTVARRTGLRVGDHFHPSHDIVSLDHHKHDEEYLVVGVLEPTNSPSDRVVWIPIEGFFRMGGHELRGTGEVFTATPGETIPDEHKEISAVLLKFKNPQVGMMMNFEINKGGKEATLAWPIGKSLAELFEKLGFVNKILELVAYLVVAVAAGSILASLYNTMNERRKEFAIMRSLGARRRTVFTVIVMEACAIATLGGILGWLVYAVILSAAAGVVRDRTGVSLETFAMHPALIWTPVLMAVTGAIAGLLPAFKAYRTDVASSLAS